MTTNLGALSNNAPIDLDDLANAATGSESPEGVVTGNVGDLYNDTTNGDLWVKETGAGNTGWVHLLNASGSVPMTGDLDLGGNDILDALSVTATTATGLTFLRDSNDDPALQVVARGAAGNYLAIANEVAGAHPRIAATGVSDDINLRLVAKGSGVVSIDANNLDLGGNDLLNLGAAGVDYTAGAGSPEGAVTADQGSIYSDTTNGALYVKRSGAATNTGWESATNGGLVFNVKDFGAVGDGTTDDSAAFIAAFDAAKTTSVADPTGIDPVRRIQATIIVPPGTYRLVSQDSLFSHNAGGYRHRGLAWQGFGNSSHIIFDPASDNQRLAYDDDLIVGPTFRDLAFTSANPTSTFIQFNSSGGPQNWYFERCDWIGDWKYGIHMTGTNSNSECVYQKCWLIGSFSGGFLYSPDTDQVLAHDFTECTVWLRDPPSGPAPSMLVNFPKGGNVTWSGGELIDSTTGGTGSTFFSFTGGSHSRGVLRFSMSDTRIELKNPTSRVIYCEWYWGSINFSNVDESSQSGATTPTGPVHEYTATNLGGVQVRYESCMLQGTHSYTRGVAASDYPQSISYSDCHMLNATDPDDFFATQLVSGSNFGGLPPITLERCRGSDWSVAGGNAQKWDSVFNWSVATNGPARPHIVNLSDVTGGMPHSSRTFDVKVPVGSVVTGVRFFCPAGVMGSAVTTWVLKVETNETIPTVLAELSPGTALSAGFEFSVDFHWLADTADKAHLTLSADATKDQFDVEEVCLLEYVG